MGEQRQGPQAQHQSARQHLQHGDLGRGHVAQAARGDRGACVECGGQQGQGHAYPRACSSMRCIHAIQSDQAAAQCHAQQGQQQPGQLAAFNGLALQRRQSQQHEGLHVVDHGGHGDGAVVVGAEEGDPVEHQGDAAAGQPQPFPALRGDPFAPPGQPQAQAQCAQHAAGEYDQQRRQRAFHDEQADGARQRHGQQHAPGAALAGSGPCG